jgi:predicted ATPase
MISYRRSDSAGITGRIFDRLAAHFGSDYVFMDIDAIPLGVDFRKYIDSAMKTMDFLIVIIGPEWLGPRPDGSQRIDSPDDPVRVELEMASRNELRIVPVLVEGANMPPQEALPESLRGVAFLNAANVAPGIDFQNHVDRLIRFLEAAPSSREVPGEFPGERVAGNIPKRLTTVIGRTEDIAAIEAMLQESHLVTITGAGGIGKTRISLEVGRDLQSTYVDGAWFVDLAPLRSSDLVSIEIASTLGVQQTINRPILDAIVEYLKKRNILLVIDNCEHVIAEAAHVIGMILSECPETHILATSRESLGVEGEHVYQLPSLPVPPADAALSPREALNFAAIALFLERAVAANARFALTEENAGTVCEICRRLDGIPLAIELAAARVNVLSPREIRDRLNERFRILTGSSRTLVQRQQTMRAAIDWSFELLAPSERILFSRLAIFAGGCTLEAAESTCAFGEVDQTEILEALSSLVRKSLLVADFDEPETRYKLLESAHAYASEKAASDWDNLSNRLATWVSSFIERAVETGWKVPQEAWLAQIQREIDNIRLALEWSLSSSEHGDTAAQIAGRLAMFWYDAGLQGEGQRWIEAALSRVDEQRAPSIAGRLWRAVALNAIGRTAVTAAEKALVLLGQDGDRRELARANGSLAYALFQVGRFQEADSAAIKALDLYVSENLGDTREYADTLETRATIVRALGLDSEARKLHDQSLAIFVAIGDERGTAIVRGNLAEFEFVNGNVHEALRLVNEAAETFRRLGATTREATALVNAATYHLELGELDEALTAARDALALAQRTEATPIISVALQDIAAVRALGGEAPAAARLIGYVDEWYRREGYEREWSERRIADRITTALRTNLPLEDFGRLHAVGAALTEREAIQEALTQ